MGLMVNAYGIAEFQQNQTAFPRHKCMLSMTLLLPKKLTHDCDSRGLVCVSKELSFIFKASKDLLLWSQLRSQSQLVSGSLANVIQLLRSFWVSDERLRRYFCTGHSNCVFVTLALLGAVQLSEWQGLHPPDFIETSLFIVCERVQISRNPCRMS